MKYVHLAIIMIVLIACGYQTAAAGDGQNNQWNGWNPWTPGFNQWMDWNPWMPHYSQWMCWNPWAMWYGTSSAAQSGEPLMFAQNNPNPPNEEEIREQFLDSYFHNVPIPRSTDPWSRVRLMIMWRLVDYLDIDEDTSKGFFPIYSDYLQERNQLMDEQRRLTQSITDSVEKESSDVNALKKSADRLTTIENELVRLRRDFLDDSEDRLTPRQYVKLVVFDEQMKNDLLRRILPDGRRGGDRDGRFPNPNPESNRGDR